MVTTDTKLVARGWEINLLWIGANVLSIFGGMLLGAFLNEILWTSNLPPGADAYITNPVQRAIIFGLSIGSIQSLLEGFVLQRYTTNWKWKNWLLVSTFGWTVATTAAELSMFHPAFGVNQLLAGTVIGLSQWLILRRYVPKAYWWILTTALGSLLMPDYLPLGYTFLIMFENFFVFIIAGLWMGIMTGTTLSWLLTLAWLEAH